MRIQTPLARARHLGSAMEGPEHWWMQRMTSLMLIPLTLWFVASMWWLVVDGGFSATHFRARPEDEA